MPCLLEQSRLWPNTRIYCHNVLDHKAVLSGLPSLIVLGEMPWLCYDM